MYPHENAPDSLIDMPVDPFEEAHIPKTKLERLEWTSRGCPCWAEFRDADELSGRDMKAIRRAAEGERGEQANGIYTEVLRLLIAKWSIGYAPTLQVPGETVRPDIILDQLSAFDLRRLENYVTPLARWLARGDENAPEEGFGSPRTPARG